MTLSTQSVRERPILFSAPMVRAILDGTKFQTRRVVKLPKHARFENATVSTWDERAERLRSDNHADDPAIGYLLGERTTGQDLVCNMHFDVGIHVARCPYGQPGDRLWVKETHALICDPLALNAGVVYLADGAKHWIPDGSTLLDGKTVYNEDKPEIWKHRPSIFMPRWASRITLELTDVRVQRVQEISEEDARAEGIVDGGCLTCGNPEPCGCNNAKPDARDAFAYLWDSINQKRNGGAYSWQSNPWVWCMTFKRVEVRT